MPFIAFSSVCRIGSDLALGWDEATFGATFELVPTSEFVPCSAWTESSADTENNATV